MDPDTPPLGLLENAEKWDSQEGNEGALGSTEGSAFFCQAPSGGSKETSSESVETRKSQHLPRSQSSPES